jgi:hypothetical protein
MFERLFRSFSDIQQPDPDETRFRKLLQEIDTPPTSPRAALVEENLNSRALRGLRRIDKDSPLLETLTKSLKKLGELAKLSEADSVRVPTGKGERTVAEAAKDCIRFIKVKLDLRPDAPAPANLSQYALYVSKELNHCLFPDKGESHEDAAREWNSNYSQLPKILTGEWNPSSIRDDMAVTKKQADLARKEIERATAGAAEQDTTTELNPKADPEAHSATPTAPGPITPVRPPSPVQSAINRVADLAPHGDLPRSPSTTTVVAHEQTQVSLQRPGGGFFSLCGLGGA